MANTRSSWVPGYSLSNSQRTSHGGAPPPRTITKTGNSHARRVLIESAWAYRYPAKVSCRLQLHLEKVATAIQDISWKAQVHLCKCSRRLVARGKNINQVMLAIAREMAAFVWTIARETEVAHYGQTVRESLLFIVGVNTQSSSKQR